MWEPLLWRLQVSAGTEQRLFEAAETDDLAALTAVFSSHADPVDLVLNTRNHKAGIDIARLPISLYGGVSVTPTSHSTLKLCL